MYHVAQVFWFTSKSSFYVDQSLGTRRPSVDSQITIWMNVSEVHCGAWQINPSPPKLSRSCVTHVFPRVDNFTFSLAYYLRTGYFTFF